MATHYSNRFERKHYTTQSRHITTTPDSGSTVFTNDLVFNDVLLETGPAKILVLDDSNMLKYKDEGGEFIASDLDLIHTATSNNDSALYIQTNDDTIYTDHSAIDINYKLTNPNPGLGAIINANFDIDDTVSGTIYGANFKRGNGSADITGLNIGANINVINQETGNLQNIGIGFINAIDHTADFNDPLILNNIFVNDNDYIEIGSPSQFSQVNIVLDTGANIDCQVDFEYWNGSAFVFLSVLDGTQGMTVSGSLSLSPPGDWALNAGTYNIRAVRRRNNLTTTPILQQVQISSTIQLYWDKDGLLRVANFEIFSVGGNVNNEKILYYNDATKRVEFRNTQEVLDDNYNGTFNTVSINNDNAVISTTNDSIFIVSQTPATTTGGKIFQFASNTTNSSTEIEIKNNGGGGTAHSALRLRTGLNAGNMCLRHDNSGVAYWVSGYQIGTGDYRWNFSGDAGDFLTNNANTMMVLSNTGNLTTTGSVNADTLLVQNAPSTPAEVNILTYNTTSKSVGYRALPSAIEGLCNFVDSGASTIPIVNVATNVVINNTSVVNMSVGINDGVLVANASTGQFTYNGASQIYVMIHMEFSITSDTVGSQEIELESAAAGFAFEEMTFTTHATPGSYIHVSTSRIASVINGSVISFSIRNNTSTDDVIVKNLEISAHTLH